MAKPSIMTRVRCYKLVESQLCGAGLTLRGKTLYRDKNSSMSSLFDRFNAGLYASGTVSMQYFVWT